jgi:hypothetical protein
MTFISGSRFRFRDFDAQLDRPHWPSLRVLDFGGNVGNLLLDQQCTIEHENYWSVDVSRDAIIVGRRRFPRANFVYYDRFHPSFNPDGDPTLELPSLGTFDIILAYSILTHLSLEETEHLWTPLRAMLRPEGRFAFTFLDPRYRPAPRLPTNLEERLHITPFAIDDRETVAIVDGRLAPIDRYPERARQYDVLHSRAFIERWFPGVLVKRPVYYDRQHCAVLGAR